MYPSKDFSNLLHHACAKRLSFSFIFGQTIRTETVGIPFHDRDHIFFQYLHLLTPAVVVAIAGELLTTFRTCFCCHSNKDFAVLLT
jgi:hypothetical protein